MSQVVVVIGGAPLAALALERVRDGATVIAADSGLDHAVAAGLRPSLLVGDLDSISAAGRMWAYAHEVAVEEHPVDKDASDTELAIAAALRVPGVQHLLVLAGDGNRLDHMLGTILALGHPSLAALRRVTAFLGSTELVVLQPGNSARLDLEPGCTFSVLALHGACTGVNVSGAHWPLVDAEVPATSTRGLSNEAGDDCRVSVDSGVLTVVIPWAV